MSSLLFSTSVVAAFLGGIVALFAPCCVSVMLPAYLATGIHRRRGLIAMTFIFAAGVATIILPLAAGASALSRLISGEHALVYSIMAVVMLSMGVAMIAGFRLPIPMLGGRVRQGRGPGPAYVLGVFSGVATACCAPVLAGVIALSGVAGSFFIAMVLGLAYVFGMVAPLFVIALVWDGKEIGATRWLSSRSVHLRLARHSRTVSLSSFVGGLLLLAMGLLVAVLAYTGPDMASRGWQVTVSGDAQHYAHVVTTWLAQLPGWITALAVFAALGTLAIVAVHQVADHAEPDPSTDPLPSGACVTSCTSTEEATNNSQVPIEQEHNQ